MCEIYIWSEKECGDRYRHSFSDQIQEEIGLAANRLSHMVLRCNLDIHNNENGSTIILKETIYYMYRYTRPARGEMKELEIPYMGPGRGNLSFHVRCAQFWNFLPSSIHFLPSLSRFKKVIRQHLFELDP